MHGAFIRPATTATQKLSVLAVAHAANASSEPLPIYQARRLHHHRRSRATWWLLEEAGEPASAMVCHPLRLSVDGEVVPGFGVGAVVTRPDRRNQGHASALCEHVAQVCAREGRPVGLLFSAIPPDEAEGLRAVASLAASFGRSAFHGWLEPSTSTADWLEDVGRARTLPMVLGLEPSARARFWASDYF